MEESRDLRSTVPVSTKAAGARRASTHLKNLDLELDRYLRQAWEHNAATYAPPGNGRPFKSPMWEFIRSAKAHPGLLQSNAFDAVQLVLTHLSAWLPKENDPWRACFPNSDDPCAEFVDTWNKIKWPRPEVEHAFQEAKLFPLRPIRPYSEKYVLFISMAGHLQRSVDGPILLPCHKFAGLLECKAMSVSRYRHLAIKETLLRLERCGRRAQREADEFTFAVDRFDWITGNEIRSENLNICVTSKSERGRYTDTQELQMTQDTERNTESKESQESKDSKESKEIKDSQGEAREHSTSRKARIRPGPYIPTTEELAISLQETAHLRPLNVLQREASHDSN